MNITLTQKDTDFTLGFLRSDLQRINCNFDRANENEKKLDGLKEKIENEGGGIEKMFLSAFDR